MSETLLAVEGKLAALRAGFLKRLPETLATIEGAWIVYNTSKKEDALAAICQIAHKLAGSGATFGCSEVGTIARSLENAIRTAVDQKRPPEDARVVASLIRELRSAATAPSDSAPASVANTQTSVPIPTSALANRDADSAPESIPSPRIVYLIDDDTDLAAYMSDQIGNFGYAVKVFHDFEPARAAIVEQKPNAILLEVAFPSGEFAGPDFAASLANSGCADIPVLFMSGRADTATRLRSVRAGGRAFFPKPIVLNDVITWIDKVTLPSEPEPNRILIVDDQESLASAYAAYLESAGMESHVVSDPMRVLDELAKFNPDLILLDMYMPSVNGDELARMIRQMDAYLSVPIVFLSGENNADRQLHAMKLGGDAFLTKPITSAHLISAVESRAARYKSLRALTDRDGLTGLVNRRKFDEHLAIELSRAQRQKRPLTLAVIDIDHFKKVNDTHGHACGDRVLRNLARLLAKRIRRTDIAARFGGEEFCVLLTDVDAVTARPVVDRLRESFSRVEHQMGSAMFSSTFSCGLADAPRFTTPKSLFDAADRALYDAKHSGRNRLIVAPE
ncbi:MAG: diguanylate cyclase [Burkholderiales bacterium]